MSPSFFSRLAAQAGNGWVNNRASGFKTVISLSSAFGNSRKEDSETLLLNACSVNCYIDYRTFQGIYESFSGKILLRRDQWKEHPWTENPARERIIGMNLFDGLRNSPSRLRMPLSNRSRHDEKFTFLLHFSPHIYLYILT